MYGILAALIHYKFKSFWEKSKLFFLAVGLLLLTYLYTDPLKNGAIYPPIFFNLESITTFCFLPFFSLLKRTKLKWVDAAFMFISIISYSMYLLHNTVIIGHVIPAFEGLLNRNHLDKDQTFMVNTVFYWGSTIFASYLLYKYFEYPMTNLREKFNSKKV